MKSLVILAIMMGSFSAVAANGHIKNCSSEALEGYQDEEIEYHTPEGKIINIQGSKARSIFINLKVQETIDEEAGSARKVAEGFDCVKQEVENLKCGVYLCMVTKK